MPVSDPGCLQLLTLASNNSTGISVELTTTASSTASWMNAYWACRLEQQCLNKLVYLKRQVINSHQFGPSSFSVPSVELTTTASSTASWMNAYWACRLEQQCLNKLVYLKRQVINSHQFGPSSFSVPSAYRQYQQCLLSFLSQPVPEPCLQL